MGNRSSINNMFVDKVDEIVEKMTENIKLSQFQRKCIIKGAEIYFLKEVQENLIKEIEEMKPPV